MQKYLITEQNLPAHEWIGLLCTVAQSPDAGKKGLKGKIVDETKNTLLIQTQTGEKVLPKTEVKLEIELDGKKVALDTANWCFSPENRIKAFFKKKKN